MKLCSGSGGEVFDVMIIEGVKVRSKYRLGRFNKVIRYFGTDNETIIKNNRGEYFIIQSVDFPEGKLYEQINELPVDARELSEVQCQGITVPVELLDISEVESMAASLFDGGWRSSDRDELMLEYGFSRTDAELICSYLDELCK